MDLFTYGSLMDARLFAAVAGERRPGRRARLADHRAVIVKHGGYPGLEYHRGAHTEGVLYRNLSRAALHRLDRFEGRAYLKAVVEVTDGDDRPVSALCYMVHPRARRRFGTRPWRWSRFRRAHLARMRREVGC